MDLKWVNGKQHQTFFREFIFTNNLIVFRDVDDVHDMMDDISEQTDIANEISEAISTSLGGQTDFDEVCFAFELTGKK